MLEFSPYEDKPQLIEPRCLGKLGIPQAQVYGVPHLPIDSKILNIAPLAPPKFGGNKILSPPELGDLGGKNLGDERQETYVYTVASSSRETLSVFALAKNAMPDQGNYLTVNLYQ